MKILILGGGPAGLYSGSLIKKTHPRWDITVIERNPHDATYGWGVVFSDRTLASFREADYPSYREITDRFVPWDTIEVRYRGESIRCGGNVFAGISRKVLLGVLQKRCHELGVELKFRLDVTDLSQLPDYDLLIGADGVNSVVRKTYASAFGPRLAFSKSKLIWLGTRKGFDAFTFTFHRNEHGLFQSHIYPNDGTVSTFIAQCDLDTWRRAGLDRTSEAESVAYCEKVFAEDLDGEPLLSNKSDWIAFVTVSNRTWHHRNIVLMGDAAHTADPTIGSGTKMAMEDAIALGNAFERYGDRIEPVLNDFELARRPIVESLQKAALESNRYFENVKRYEHFEPLQFVYYLLTRSGRISYDELRRRDPSLVDAVDRWFFETTTHAGGTNLRLVAPQPALAPLKLREMRLVNRVAVSMPLTYSARDGFPDESYYAALKNLAHSGAALVITEPVAVSPQGRITPGCCGLYRSEHVKGWSQMAALVHSAGGRITIRLGHAGPRGSTRPRAQGVDLPLTEGGWPLLSASPIPFLAGGPVPKAMDQADIDRVRDQFVDAVRMADEADFDMVELFFAHGYLVASFLSPLTNRRDDQYAGALENRARFALEIFEAVREVWPKRKPLVAAIPGSDCAKGGFEVEDAVIVAGLLRARGCDLVEPLAGQTTVDSQPVFGPGFLTPFSDQVRNEARVATLTGGYITTTDEVNNIIAGGRADLCIMEPPGLNPRYRPVARGSC